MISLKRFGKSLLNAWHGLQEITRAEQSFRIQLAAATVVVILATVFPLSTWERVLLLLLTTAVLVLEIINSIIERVADAVHPRLNPMVREVKDMMAAAVLLTALTSAIIGSLVFYPHLAQLVCAILQPCVGAGTSGIHASFALLAQLWPMR